MLVHGIRTDGKWMEAAEQRLSAFFDCLPYAYREYRSSLLGGVKLVLHPGILLVSLIASAAVGFLPWASSGVRASGTSLVALGGVFIAMRAANQQREHAIDKFAEFFGNEVQRHGRVPHLIAHSLGTYLTGRAVLRFGGIRFGRVIYCASVLDRRFDWAGLIGQRSVLRVRNEMGLRDFVPAFARLLGLFGFGDSGLRGFIGQSSIVHTIPEGSLSCVECAQDAAPVHNVPLDAEHSSHFIGGLHAENFWLPFLLGYDPAEYRLLMDLCADLDELDKLGFFDVRDELEEQLSLMPWTWLRGRTLGDAALVLLKGHHPHLKSPGLESLLFPYARHAVGLFWRYIASAQEIRGSGNSEPDWAVSGLDPNWVLAVAAECVA